MNSSDVKTQIESSSEPLVFDNLLKWELLRWDLQKWNECLGNTKLQFRLGQKTASKEPQWEKTCEVQKGTFEDFRNFTNKDKWLYFDYKYLNQWFIDKFDLRNEITWKDFGYDIKAEDCTIWIGTEGAHTPCHVDTYGFNLVAQLKGRKLWLLFPPDTDMNATRVPYEESTVYSSVNLYSPEDSTIDSLSKVKCKKIILEPGQVLFVPNGWWHYVENLELSISINTWVPMESDNQKRVMEALTLLMMKSLTSGLKHEEREVLINNTQGLSEISTLDVLNLTETSLNSCKSSKSDNTDKAALVKSDCCKTIEYITEGDFKSFLKSQSNRFEALATSASINAVDCRRHVCLVKKYLSVLTDPEVLKLIESKLTKAT